MNEKLREQIERERMAGLAACNRFQAKVAALEARCAGLERERDKLQRHYDRCRCTVMDLEQQRDVALDERDALQAKLAAAVEALRKAESWTDHIHTALAESLRPKQAVGEMVYGLLDFLRATLAGHAPRDKGGRR